MKKYFICLLLTISSGLLFAQPPFNGNGTGALNAPYQIWTRYHLKELSDSLYNDAFRSNCWHCDKHFRLMQDIDAITQTECLSLFNGYFHGSNKKITLLNTNGYPFISMLYGTVDSLIVDGYINNGGAAIVGGVATSSAVINYCTSNVTISIDINGFGVGGVVGLNMGVVINCVNNGYISVYGMIDMIGGVVGRNDAGGHIINCVNSGKITTINSGYNTGLTGQPTSNNGVGGIVGSHPNATGGSIRNNINTGSVEGQDMVGGIVGVIVGSGGMSPPTSITNNLNYGFVKGNKIVGGVASWVFSGIINISNNSNFGVVVGEEDTGCIVGRNNGGILINNHYDKQMCGEED